ncbi:MAG TPA: GFA family protein [Variovorax sp.]
MKYLGSCHCGRVKFEAEGQIDKAMACNCSICQRKGALMWFVPRSAMQLLTPEANSATYLFNKHLITHRFCPTCGIHPYGEARTPAGAEMAAISIPAGVLASP